ncbi:MAG: bifunctional UDP-N-acetylmuramoyl-tripeptide:D-alanyl-D-alanine ligase/alanine racemase [Bacteroidota bacterium]|nr:bifunctional UDP-N-acetylmuramoyl-tripeptide:D-alanyl-D-alanine ligase/alanine racemase [Bacteroidota bacterium]
MYKISEIANFLNSDFIGNGESEISTLIFDSRMIIPFSESLFFALKSNNNDGHSYISNVYKKGIKNFVVNRYFKNFEKFPNSNFIIVDNTTKALQKLATQHRKQFDIPVFAITGSNGKTIVKEWLSQMLNVENKALKSPKSYNSQIGVPLSVWELSNIYDVAVFEAGISKTNEMAKLEEIIKPTIALITNIGDAHQENFIDLNEKLNEKLNLFNNAAQIIYSTDFKLIDELVNENYSNIKKFTWSISKHADLQATSIIKNEKQTIINLKYKLKEYSVKIQFSDKASVENTMSLLSALLCFYPQKTPDSFDLMQLLPIEMRLQQMEGINNCTIINDSYNCDLSSLKIALDVLTAQNQSEKKSIILSDIFDVGKKDKELYSLVANMLRKSGITKIIGVGKSISANSDFFECEKYFFDSTTDFVRKIHKIEFNNEAILLKGARKFYFEHIADILQLKNHRTVLEINMSAFDYNLQYFRNLLKPKTLLMVMVKAFSYGTGSFEIANYLQRKNVDYLAVAIADEGIALRKAGITLPILILNPDVANFELFVEYSLEPEIYSLRMLNEFYNVIKNKVYNSYPIHLKINTGMNRLGFTNNEIDKLIEKLNNSSKFFVKSVFSHLSAADDESFDDFTISQVEKFNAISQKLENNLKYKFLRHILNSAGIERFNHFQFDMVRLGIGLYGISKIDNSLLKNISTLKTRIIQIFEVEKGQTVGYSRAWKAKKDSLIATLPIGYADGLDRRLSNEVGKVFINKKSVPIVGNICMDLTMIDVSGLSVEEGDEVEIFGKQQTISQIADNIGTINYEVLTSISQRVKRVYSWEK